MAKSADPKKKKNKPGPKPSFTLEFFNEKIEKFFNETPIDEITITGLCIFLGMNKDTFYEYNKRPEYKPITEMARLRVEHAYELSLRKYGRAGDIFALKNFGWRDKQEVSVGAGDFSSSLDKFVNKIGETDGE